MSGRYTAIEPDISETPTVGQEQSQQPLNGSGNGPIDTPATSPDSLLNTIKQSSHPIALVFFIIFRVLPILVYLFGNLFLSFITKSNRFILHFITLILLNAADFWNLKNVSGRLLVGLRWWNEINQIDQSGTFENVWVFETSDPNRYINPVDSKIFWLLLYVQPGIWIVLAVLSLLKLQFLYLLFILISISLSLTNAIAFTRCDKFNKANNITNNIFSKAFEGLFSRFKF